MEDAVVEFGGAEPRGDVGLGALEQQQGEILKLLKNLSTTPPAPTPMTNEMSTMLDGQELAVGDEIEALGSAPGGSRVWFRAKVVALRSRYPPIHVKFTATLEGVTHRLALPEPVTAYVNADGVRRIAG